MRATLTMFNRRLASASCLLLTLLVLSVPAAAGEFKANTMRFDHVTVADGLAQSSVMAIAQDNYGFLWLATESGLNRYDGVTFRNYRSERGNIHMDK